MKILFALLLSTLIAVPSIYNSLEGDKKQKSLYPPGYVTIANVTHKNEKFNVVTLKREGNKIKAKYFVAPMNGKSVSERYKSWSNGKDGNIVLVSSGTYMDGSKAPVGFSIDNGIIVNSTLRDSDMDALVIVYATGGVVCSNLKNADLTIKGRKYDLRGNGRDLAEFKTWAEDEEATVFQTHLLVYNNKLTISSINSSTNVARRRFLAVGKDEDGKLVHMIVQCPNACTLYEGANKTFNFLREKQSMDITFMINLDTGYQDVFKLYNEDGTINSAIYGEKDLSVAINLLAYYYE
ncbi:MAG: hypothetical protein M0D57_08450 [Sphingobacteriales bacterium JAD_PAG50586_3]|jgi:hypothetical protein|nr:MAG: hypothetical protein M0D57_08450 [Sphingobacteriales bacterium JAD_PAG50586_3]